MAKAEDLLTKVTGLRADAFAASAPAAIRSPELTVVVRFDDTKMEQVSFARAGADVVASRADEPGAATLAAAAYEEAVKALDALE
ncbi:hypothetical protein D3C83_28800 [compost metagenome]